MHTTSPSQPIATSASAPSPPPEPSAERTSPAPEAGRFVERRGANRGSTQGKERRQFGSAYHDLSADARELAMAIDGYKVKHRRRYVTFEEMLSVIRELGYDRPPAG